MSKSINNGSQIKGNHKDRFHVLPCIMILPAFDAETVTKLQFPLIFYIKLLKVLHCGFEFSIDSDIIIGLAGLSILLKEK